MFILGAKKSSNELVVFEKKSSAPNIFFGC